MSLKNKKILVIIGGGISAYKSLDLLRLLTKNNVEVKAILTKSGKEFVTPLSVTTLTKNKVLTDTSSKDYDLVVLCLGSNSLIIVSFKKLSFIKPDFIMKIEPLISSFIHKPLSVTIAKYLLSREKSFLILV